MTHTLSNPVIDAVRRSLNHEPGASPPSRPPTTPSRMPGSPAEELALLLREIETAAGHTQQLAESAFDSALSTLVETEHIRTAVVWNTPMLKHLDVVERLARLGVVITPPIAGKHALAKCDLGVTSVDFAVPDSGTLGLLSGPERPRAVSLLPAVHLALLTPAALRSDLHQVFAEAKHQGYLLLITGPSRTADIELTLTLGVHGPRELYVFALEENP